MAQDVSLPIREDGCIVESAFTSIFGASECAGYYVQHIPEEGTRERERFENDGSSMWCDTEIVHVPYERFGGEPSEQELIEEAYRLTFEEKVSVCKRCHTTVKRGTLEKDGDGVMCLCGECSDT